MSKGITSELWAFMRERKKFWMLPIIAMLLLVGTLLNFAVAAIPAQDAQSPPTEKQPLTS